MEVKGFKMKKIDYSKHFCKGEKVWKPLCQECKEKKKRLNSQKDGEKNNG